MIKSFFLLHRLVVPLIFKQYFVIHVMIGNKYIPCAYVYMSGKYEEADYDRVFAAPQKMDLPIQKMEFPPKI